MKDFEKSCEDHPVFNGILIISIAIIALSIVGWIE